MPGNRPPVSAISAAALVVLGFVQALWPLTMDLYLPAFPEIGEALRTSPELVSLTLTGAFVGMALGQLSAGPLSDRVGRTRPLVSVLVMYAVATVVCALAPTIEVLVLFRAVQGLGSAAAAVITLAIVRDCAAGARMVRLLARLQLINGTFVVTAPALGALLLSLVDWRGLFWILVAYGSAVAVAVLLTVARRETLPKSRRRPHDVRALFADYRTLLADHGYLVALAANTLLWAGMMGYMASSSFLFQEVYGVRPTMYAIIFGGHGAVMIIAAQITARVTTRFGLPRVIGAGAVVAGASAVALILAVALTPPGTLVAFLVPLFGFTAGFGVLSPCLQASALEAHGERAGTAASLLGAGTMLAGAAAAPLVAPFAASSAMPAALLLGFCALCAVTVIAVGRISRTRQRTR